jgi:uncharacterized protein (DUF58 family)
MKFWRRNERWRLCLAGYVVVLIAFLTQVAAWNTGTNLFYIIFGGLASVLIVSFALARRSLRRLTVLREAPDAVHRGASFGVTVRIENHGRILPAVSVRLEHADTPGESAGYVLAVPARKAAVLGLKARFDTRGVFRLGGMDLVSTFPFGLIEVRKRVEEGPEVVVYPRILPARTAMVERSGVTGSVTRRSHGEGDEFFSLRDYVRGDDLRHAAWRPSARLGRLLMKEFSLETSRSVQFILDSRYRPELEGFADDFEEAIEVAASLAVTLLNRQYNVSLTTPDGFVPEGRGKAQVLKLLDFFARMEPAAPEAPDPFDHGTVADSKRAICLFVSPDRSQWGRRLSGGTHVLSPSEVVHA